MFFLLSTFRNELISAPNIINFDQAHDHYITKSNPIPYPEYLYLSKLAFLVILTAPNKELLKVESTPCAYAHKFVS